MYSLFRRQSKAAEFFYFSFILLQSFSEEDYNYIIDGWKEKLNRCSLGDQRWGLFYAEKPLEIVP